jgi:hypothetical protein
VPTEEVGAVTATPAAPDPVEARELQDLVWEAAEGLAPQDKAVLFLHLRHGLSGQELGEALEVSAHHANVRLSRVRGLVERSLTVLLVGRLGRRDCPDLDVLLAGWDGRLDPRLRKRVARHIDDCDVCAERRRTVVSPLGLLAVAPLVPAPRDLRDRVLTSVGASPPDLGGADGSGGGASPAYPGGAAGAIGGWRRGERAIRAAAAEYEVRIRNQRRVRRGGGDRQRTGGGLDVADRKGERSGRGVFVRVLIGDIADGGQIVHPVDGQDEDVRGRRAAAVGDRDGDRG